MASASARAASRRELGSRVKAFKQQGGGAESGEKGQGIGGADGDTHAHLWALETVAVLAQVVIGLSAQLALGAHVPSGTVAFAIDARLGAAHAT